MSPSEAHDSAWQRTPEHDEMVYACWQWLNSTRRPMTAKIGEYRPTTVTLSFEGAWMEHHMVAPKERPFFADILAHYSYEEQIGDRKPEARRFYRVFEIKPTIYSAGALLRQVRVQKDRLKKWHADQYSTNSDVWAIVSAGDPLAQLFANMAREPVLLWGGKDIKQLGPQPA
jgi:hypothetical protein